MVWRGPMVTQALEQLLRDTNWRDLDYLIVDLPPGTGDIQLTLAQKVPVTGAVIVTTPQDIALIDARKGLKMFEKVGVPILGIVENMAVHICSNCGHAEHIFGEGGGERMAAEYGMDYLGALPLDIKIRVQADSGKPTVVADPDGEVAGIYKAVARQVAIKIAAKAKDFSSKFPSIKISTRRRRRPAARTARNGEPFLHRSRPLARRAGACRQRAAAGRPGRVAAGLHRRALPTRAEAAAPAAIVPRAGAAAVMTDQTDGFLSRWARRKAEARAASAARRAPSCPPWPRVPEGIIGPPALQAEAVARRGPDPCRRWPTWRC